jgi:hypothetical protein
MNKAQALYNKVQAQAERDWERQEEKQRLEIIRRNAQQPDTRYEQNIKRLSQLRRKTFEIECELKAIRQVEAASERHLAATMKLRAANRTPAEKKAYDAEIRRGQILFSRIVPENHPDDRRQQENPYAEYYRHQQAPTHDRGGKQR